MKSSYRWHWFIPMALAAMPLGGLVNWAYGGAAVVTMAAVGGYFLAWLLLARREGKAARLAPAWLAPSWAERAARGTCAFHASGSRAEGGRHEAGPHETRYRQAPRQDAPCPGSPYHETHDRAADWGDDAASADAGAGCASVSIRCPGCGAVGQPPRPGAYRCDHCAVVFQVDPEGRPHRLPVLTYTIIDV